MQKKKELRLVFPSENSCFYYVCILRPKGLSAVLHSLTCGLSVALQSLAKVGNNS